VSDVAACPSSMTLGTGWPAFDEWLAAIMDEPYEPLPVHQCDQAPGHKLPHTADGFTWDAITITAPVRWPSG